MSLSAPKEPRQTSRWETIRDAIDSNARTIRLCVILLVLPLGSGLAAAVIELVRNVHLPGAPRPRQGLRPGTMPVTRRLRLTRRARICAYPFRIRRPEEIAASNYASGQSPRRCPEFANELSA